MASGEVTGETITMAQIIQTYWESRDASVVRACVTVLHGSPMIFRIANPGSSARNAALEAVAAAWNATAGALAGADYHDRHGGSQ